MKDVTLKFIGTGYNGINEAQVKIYSDNEMIWKGNTYNGRVNCKLKNRCFYRLIAQTKYAKINKYFYINDNNTYIFSFYYCIQNNSPVSRLITFRLTDYYYDNLPISKGELNFGENS